MRKSQKAKLSKGMELSIINLWDTAMTLGSTHSSLFADKELTVEQKQEKYKEVENKWIKAKKDLEKKIAYIQEENSRMKRVKATCGLRFDIYPINV